MFRKALIAAVGALGLVVAGGGCEREEGRTPGGTTRPAPTTPPPSEQPRDTQPPPAPNPPEDRPENPR